MFFSRKEHENEDLDPNSVLFLSQILQKWKKRVT